jgi:beta-lactamase class A
MLVRRRGFLTSIGAGFAALAVPASLAARPNAGIGVQLAAIESNTGGRLGMFALDTSNGRHIARHANERFPMCSTFKLLLVADVLARVDAGQEHLDRRIPYGTADLLAYAPVTSRNVNQGSMSVAALCKAAIQWSDNTAANLLLATVGGPPGVTSYVRSLGDSVTRLDRNEPSLNSAIPGDVRDTTTPAAMARDTQAIVLGNALSAATQKRLTTWMVGTQTGLTSIRAGVPSTWVTADKTGTGEHGTHNDVAVLWPPNRSPIVVAAYVTGASVSNDALNVALAGVGAVVRQAFT